MALLTWRFFTFYLFLIVGVGMVLLEKIILKREKSRMQLEQHSLPDTAGTDPPETAEASQPTDSNP